MDGDEVCHHEPPEYKNDAICIEISPAIEHTEDFTLDDWRQLWRDFAAASNNQVVLDKEGKTISAKTNISGSKSSVWLHEESKSGILHLHAIAGWTRMEHQQRPLHTS